MYSVCGPQKMKHGSFKRRPRQRMTRMVTAMRLRKSVLDRNYQWLFMGEQNRKWLSQQRQQLKMDKLSTLLALLELKVEHHRNQHSSWMDVSKPLKLLRTFYRHHRCLMYKSEWCCLRKFQNLYRATKQ